jgi:acetyltransferase-like isoleucine patch superfamily enzyme
MRIIINKLLIKMNYIICSIKNNYVTFLEIIYLKFIGVEIGSNCQFRGWSSFLMVDDSTVKINKNCRFNSTTTSNRIGINHKCMISTLQKGAYLEIGSDSGFSGVSIGCFKKIIIGNNVRVGANVLITDSDWHLEDSRVSDPKPIYIGNNVWLGYGVVVMKGVTIGDNTIIGINSVVTKDIPSNVIAVGNPCKVIKTIF